MKRQSIDKVTIKNRDGQVTGFRWRARFWSPQGRETSRRFGTKKAAQAWVDEQTGAKITGQYVDPRDGRVTFRAYAEGWRARQIHRDSTAEKIRHLLENHAYPALGAIPLSDLRHSHIQAWVSRMAETLAPSTVRVHHGVVAGLLNDAVEDRMLALNPCGNTKLPAEVDRAIVIPTDSAVRQIHGLITPRYAAAIHLAAGTGVRQGELFGLTVDRVDFLRREVTIDRQLIMGGAKRNNFGPPKTKKSNRVIPVAQDVIDSIAVHLAEFGEGPERVIFSSSYGGYVSKSTFNTALAKAVAKAGMRRSG